MKLIDCRLNAWHPDFVSPIDPKAYAAAVKRVPNIAANRQIHRDLPALVEAMDESGVANAVMCAQYDSDLLQRAIEYAREQYPGRFVGAASVEPQAASIDVAKVRRLAERGYASICLTSAISGVAYDDARYFPIYAACEEAGLVVDCQVGLPHAPISNQTMHPLTLDPVLDHFPDLTIVMYHAGLPWAAECVAMMRKWPRLCWMSSAVAEHRMPREIIDFGNDDGDDRLMWGTDFPALSFEEKEPAGANAHFAAEAAENYAWRTAERIYLRAAKETP